jgi:hypothetical protein
LSRFLSKDFLSGVMFIAFGLVALWFGRHLALGTSVRMGPGYVPHMLAYIMMVLGLIIAVVALYSGGEKVEAPKWKPITMVTIGIVVFALLFESTGMFPALIALVFIASLGGDEFKLWEVIANIVVLTLLCIAVFKVGLQMNISVINGVW